MSAKISTSRHQAEQSGTKLSRPPRRGFSQPVFCAEYARFCSTVNKGLGRVELQLVVGPGGAGKTRLAMQFCEQLWGRTDTHWHAGFLLQEAQAHAIAQLTRPGYPALIVINYAENRNLGPWLKQLMDTENARAKLRILLLARHAGEWWETLARGNAAVKHLCRHPVLHLQDVSLDGGARQRHHGLALAAFADKLHKPAPTQSAPRLE